MTPSKTIVSLPQIIDITPAVRKQLSEDDRIMTKDQPIFMY